MAIPKPPLAKWIEDGRKSKEWKVEELSRRLTDLGYDAAVGSIRVWEAPRGRPPQAATIQAMEQLFGTKAPVVEDPAAGVASLAAAIERQAAALERLAEAMEKDRESGPPWAEALVRLLRGARLPGSPTGESGEPQGSGAPLRDPA